MRALRLYAGPLARQHILSHGLAPQQVGAIPAAAGGPKGLILGPLDRFIFGHWLPQGSQPVHLLGASIGAWRMATACLGENASAFERLERDYIAQHYELPPGRKRPTPEQISERFSHNLRLFFGGRVSEVLQHPRYRLHIFTARGRHLLNREHRWLAPLGYLGAFAANAVQRRALGGWLERVVFSTPGAALPFATHDLRTQQAALTEASFMPALQASCSIPFVLQPVRGIAGAPAGRYWDGGITDYHLHLHYRLPASAPLVLYPHFQKAVVPGWFDKLWARRHPASAALASMLVLAPDPGWTQRLPGGKLPDRGDFDRFGADLAARMKVWQGATAAAVQLADEWAEWLQRPDMSRLEPL